MRHDVARIKLIGALSCFPIGPVMSHLKKDAKVTLAGNESLDERNGIVWRPNRRSRIVIHILCRVTFARKPPRRPTVRVTTPGAQPELHILPSLGPGLRDM